MKPFVLEMPIVKLETLQPYGLNKLDSFLTRKSLLKKTQIALKHLKCLWLTDSNGGSLTFLLLITQVNEK